MATPKVTRTLFDNNLDRTTPQGPQNRSVVILGTGTDGPMYEPVKVTSSADAAEVFGGFGEGTLVRGIKECFDAQVGSQAAPNVWGMRIGSSKSARALTDLSAVGGANVMRLEALYDGSTYNGIFMKKDTDATGAEKIFLWNPKTQLYSTFEITLNVNELVSAVNADPNASSVVFASAVDFVHDFEVIIDTGTDEGSLSGQNIAVNLPASSQQISGAGIESVTALYTVADSEEVTYTGLTNTFTPGTSFVGVSADAARTGVVGDELISVAVYEDTGTTVAIENAGSTAMSWTISDQSKMDLIDGSGTPTATLTVNVSDNGATPVAFILENVTVTLTDNTADYTAAASLVHDDIIAAGSSIGHDVVSVYAAWSETSVALTASTGASVTNYVVSADEKSVVFGAALPYAVVFRYDRKKYFELGSNVTISDSVGGVFALVDSGHDAAATSFHFGLDYDFIGDAPNWSTVGTPFYLAGGANGAILSTEDLQKDLSDAYEHFVTDFFDVMCVVDLTFDAVLPSGAYADFAGQMSTFLDSFNGEMVGLIGFETLAGTGVGGRVLRSDISDRVAWLTSPDAAANSGHGNAATLLADYHQPFIYAVDLEGIFSANGVRYTAISTAAVAGLIAAMPTEEAIFRFTVPGIQGMRYRYTEIDKASGQRQIDVLSNSRIATGMLDNGVKITESRTLAQPGSDFENLMTVLILQEVLQICRSVAKDFIGKVSSAPLIQAFQSSLDKQLGDALVPRVLRGFKAPISMTPGERVLGSLTIPLTLSPQFEIRDVHYNVQLTAEDIVG